MCLMTNWLPCGMISKDLLFYWKIPGCQCVGLSCERINLLLMRRILLFLPRIVNVAAVVMGAEWKQRVGDYIFHCISDFT